MCARTAFGRRCLCVHPWCSHLRVAQRLLAALVRDARGLDDGLVLALARHHEERLEGDLPRGRARGGQARWAGGGLHALLAHGLPGLVLGYHAQYYQSYSTGYRVSCGCACMLSLYRLDCVMFCLVAIESRIASWKVIGSWM